jgi:hypothetical protein
MSFWNTHESFTDEPDTPSPDPRATDLDPTTEYWMMEEVAQNLFFSIKEHLYRQGERELFRYLMWTDVARMVFPRFDEIRACIPPELR